MNIESGLDYLLAVTKDNTVYGLGDNSQQQLLSCKLRNTNEMVNLDIDLKQANGLKIKCSNSFVLCLANKPITLKATKEN